MVYRVHRDALIMIDKNGNISFWNEAATYILGYTAEAALGKNLHELIAPKQCKGKYKQAFQAFRSTGDCTALDNSIELLAVRKDQIAIPVEISLSSVMIENKWYAVGILRDISTRKRDERDLRRANEQLQTKVAELYRINLNLTAENKELANQKTNWANNKKEREGKPHPRADQDLPVKTEELNKCFSSTLDLLCFFDEKGKFLEVNSAFELILGYSADEMTSRPFLDFVHPDDVKSTKDIILRILNGHKITGFCNRYRRRDGYYRWFEWTALINEKTGICFGVARDISERKIAEDDLRKRNKEIVLGRKKVEASWRHLNNAVKNADAIIWQLDKNGIFILYEGQMLKKLAHKSGQHLGLSIFELYKDYPEILKTIKRSLKGKACQLETKYQNLIIRVFCSPFFASDGNIDGVVGITVDITKRQDWERRLKIMQENHRRSVNFNKIVVGNYNEIEQSHQLGSYGIDCKKPAVCYLIAITSENMTNLKDDVMGWLVDNGYGWSWHSYQYIAVLIQNRASILDDKDKQKAKAQELKANLERQFPDISVRIGVASIESILSLKQLYYKAYSALLLSMGDKEDSKIFHYNDGGIYSIVPFLIDHLNIDDFISQYLGEIIKQDKERNLLLTLDAILTCPNLKAVAAEMHIHHNTVLWRKNKIEKILGYTIDNTDRKLNLAAAIKLQKIREIMQKEL